MEYTEKELEQERWKPIFGYDGMYEVSDLGRVRSRKRGEWKVMKQGKVGKGYLGVKLHKYGKKNQLYVHRLVAQAFIPNDNIFNTEINHRNEIKSDNRVSNLEYCDRSYNMTYNDLNWRKKGTKRSKIKELYRPELSIDDNLEVFRANGIECSRTTIWKLRKDIGLNGYRQKYKLNKVKELYRPELSIDDNLEVFRANGIECSRTSIYRLRKDLGLTKQYNKK